MGMRKIVHLACVLASAAPAVAETAAASTHLYAAVPLCGPRCQLWREALEPHTHTPHEDERRLQEGFANQKLYKGHAAKTAGQHNPPKVQDPKLWLAEARQRQHAMLCTPHSSARCRPTIKWIKGLDPSLASLFQVGANIHQSTSYAQDDPAPLAVKMGWAAVLLEPMPDIFAKLEQHYTPRPPNVRLVNAAACDTCGDAPLQMYSVDMTSATGNWGSNDSDTRCIVANSGPDSCRPHCKGASHWTSEIASLDRSHLERHNRLFAYGPNQCRKCAQLLERPMPGDCMRQVISKNIKFTDVRCFCAATELKERLRGGSLSLLMVDAEGHDDAVLRQFPFDTIRPARILFEAYHLGQARFQRLAEYLRSWGYEMLGGSVQDYISTWHHINSTEVLAATATP